MSTSDFDASVDKILRKFDDCATKKDLEEKIKFLPNTELFLFWMDKLMGELKTVREEQIILSAHSSEHNDRVEKLEKIHPRYSHFPLL